jgi:hypothetical protein
VSRASALREILSSMGDQMTTDQVEAIERAIDDLHDHATPLHAWHCMSQEVGAVIASYDDLLELLTEQERERFLAGAMSLTEIVGLLAIAVADSPGADDVSAEERERIAAEPHGSN